jgi:hypothetical protein
MNTDSFQDVSKDMGVACWIVYVDLSLNFTCDDLFDIYVSRGDLNSSGYDRSKMLHMYTFTQNVLLSRSVAFIPNIAHVHKLFGGEGDANGAKNYFRILLRVGIGGATVS